MKRKQLTAIMIFLSIAMSLLAGCAGGNNAGQGAGGGAQNKPVTINVWAMGEEAKSLPKLAEEFEKEHENIKVKVQALPWDTAHDKLLTAVASKKGPDVVQMGTTWVPEFAAAKALMDLTPHMDTYPEFASENFYPGSIETTMYGDQIVGVPWYIDTRVLYYRSDLLAEAGYAEAPKTWDELKEAAKKLRARGGNKYGISLDVKEGSLGFMFARQNGSELIKDNKPLFNQPEFVEAVEYLNSFFQEDLAPADLGMDIIAAFRGEGILPMFISGPWMVKLINDQAPDLEGKWATAVLPGKVNNISALGGANLSVFQHTNNADQALTFVAYMSRPETQLRWMELTNSLPASKQAWEDPSFKENPLYSVFGEQMNASKPMPLITQWDEIAQNYLSSFERIYRTDADVQKEMDAFNKKAEQLLSQ